MKTLDKILYLQKQVSLSDKEFCKRYRIKLNHFKLWKILKIEPKEKEIKNLVDFFNLDIADFMNGNSTLRDDRIEAHEHLCKSKPSTIEDKNLIYEDFAREENGRYEEKD